MKEILFACFPQYLKEATLAKVYLLPSPSERRAYEEVYQKLRLLPYCLDIDFYLIDTQENIEEGGIVISSLPISDAYHPNSEDFVDDFLGYLGIEKMRVYDLDCKVLLLGKALLENRGDLSLAKQIGLTLDEETVDSLFRTSLDDQYGKASLPVKEYMAIYYAFLSCLLEEIIKRRVNLQRVKWLADMLLFSYRREEVETLLKAYEDINRGSEDQGKAALLGARYLLLLEKPMEARQLLLSLPFDDLPSKERASVASILGLTYLPNQPEKARRLLEDVPSYCGPSQEEYPFVRRGDYEEKDESELFSRLEEADLAADRALYYACLASNSEEKEKLVAKDHLAEHFLSYGYGYLGLAFYEREVELSLPLSILLEAHSRRKAKGEHQPLPVSRKDIEKLTGPYWRRYHDFLFLLAKEGSSAKGASLRQGKLVDERYFSILGERYGAAVDFDPANPPRYKESLGKKGRAIKIMEEIDKALEGTIDQESVYQKSRFDSGLISASMIASSLLEVVYEEDPSEENKALLLRAYSYALIPDNQSFKKAYYRYYELKNEED